MEGNTNCNDQELKILKANYEMLRRTFLEAKKRGNSKTISLIETAIQEVIDHTKNISDVDADKMIAGLNTNEADDLSNKQQLTLDGPDMSLFNLDEESTEQHAVKDEHHPTNNIVFVDDTCDDVMQDVGPNVQYDVIPLPSHGQCYKNKKSRIPVAYLTAFDENMITSPNLYQNGLVTDLLLKNKVQDKSVNVDDLCVGDADAIMLFLRATSYGSDFPIEVRDPETNTTIETNVDLSSLKMKEFVLEGDENGYFDYTLPVSKDHIKFKFLTRKDERMLLKMNSLEDNGVKAATLLENISSIEGIINADTSLVKDSKQAIINNLHKMDPLIERLKSKKSDPYTHSITNKLIMSIMSVNGNNDKAFIHQYVMNMPARDSLMLRRYIVENEPGIDFEITINRPESLGGGSFNTFLKWDDFIFLNIA